MVLRWQAGIPMVLGWQLHLSAFAFPLVCYLSFLSDCRMLPCLTWCRIVCARQKRQRADFVYIILSAASLALKQSTWWKCELMDCCFFSRFVFPSCRMRAHSQMTAFLLLCQQNTQTKCITRQTEGVSTVHLTCFMGVMLGGGIVVHEASKYYQQKSANFLSFCIYCFMFVFVC